MKPPTTGPVNRPDITDFATMCDTINQFKSIKYLFVSIQRQKQQKSHYSHFIHWTWFVIHVMLCMYVQSRCDCIHVINKYHWNDDSIVISFKWLALACDHEPIRNCSGRAMLSFCNDTHHLFFSSTLIPGTDSAFACDWAGQSAVWCHWWERFRSIIDCLERTSMGQLQ